MIGLRWLYGLIGLFTDGLSGKGYRISRSSPNRTMVSFLYFPSYYKQLSLLYLSLWNEITILNLALLSQQASPFGRTESSPPLSGSGENYTIRSGHMIQRHTPPENTYWNIPLPVPGAFCMWTVEGHWTWNWTITCEKAYRFSNDVRFQSLSYQHASYPPFSYYCVFKKCLKL